MVVMSFDAEKKLPVSPASREAPNALCRQVFLPAGAIQHAISW
ncbi:hypothetical protein [Burkholderia pyrrocinia]|nr:hypothetical protein [Burkholderia pyrrocinia]